MQVIQVANASSQRVLILCDGLSIVS